MMFLYSATRFVVIETLERMFEPVIDMTYQIHTTITVLSDYCTVTSGTSTRQAFFCQNKL